MMNNCFLWESPNYEIAKLSLYKNIQLVKWPSLLGLAWNSLLSPQLLLLLQHGKEFNIRHLRMEGCHHWQTNYSAIHVIVDQSNYHKDLVAAFFPPLCSNELLLMQQIHTFPFFLSVFLCLSLSFSLSFSLCLCLYVFLKLSCFSKLSQCLSFSILIIPCLSFYCFFLCLRLSLCLSLSLSVSQCLPLQVSLLKVTFSHKLTFQKKLFLLLFSIIFSVCLSLQMSIKNELRNVVNE